jgi:hypothetical protein
VLARPVGAERAGKAVAPPTSQAQTAGAAQRVAPRPLTGLRPSAVPAVYTALDSSGVPLDGATRVAMEHGFGHDFGEVRVHTGELAERSASALDADAYAVGDHVVFARDRYRPANAAGRRLIAHELAHVVQQRSSGPFSGPGEAPLEQDAERAARDVEAGRLVSVANGAARGEIQRQAVATIEPTETASVSAKVAPAPAVPPAVQAVQAEAAQGLGRLRLTVSALLASKDQTERNTGGLFSGSTPRAAYTTMTLRTDSEQIRVAVGHPPKKSAFFFVGPTQVPWDGTAHAPPGTIEHGENTLGTIDDQVNPPQVIVRVKGPDGAWLSQDQLKTTFVHESSHILVKSYGELPQTGPDDASFDRYQDEFRAYWVADFAKEPEADRWKAIRKHIVGEHATEGTYPTLRDPYWAKDAAGNWANAAFRAQIDGHHRPMGFNLSNSLRLDRLFTTLGEAKADPAKTDAAILAILQLSPTERAEAKGASLIVNLVNQLPDGPALRVREALSTPTNLEYSTRIAAVSSPGVTAFLTACALNGEDAIKAAYAALTGAEKGSIASDAAVDVFLDHHLPNVWQRAAVYAMVVSAAIGQYDVMHNFLRECLDALNDAISTPPAAPPPRMMELLKRLTLHSRLALYVLNKDAMTVFVDPLPEPIRMPVIAILRGDREP